MTWDRHCRHQERCLATRSASVIATETNEATILCQWQVTRRHAHPPKAPLWIKGLDDSRWCRSEQFELAIKGCCSNIAILIFGLFFASELVMIFILSIIFWLAQTRGLVLGCQCCH
jgi:hypothetical protein